MTALNVPEMTRPAITERADAHALFARRLHRLRHHRSDLMTLRSCLNQPSGIAPAVYPLIADTLPDRHGTEAQWEVTERAWVFAYALYAAWHLTPHVGGSRRSGRALSIGAALARLRQGRRSGEYEMRTLTRFRLAQAHNSIHKAVLLLAKENIEPDWVTLLRDLTDSDDVKVQRRWAFDYYHHRPATAATAERSNP